MNEQTPTPIGSMSDTPARQTPHLADHRPTPLWRDLAPLCLLVFLEFLAMGLPLAVLPMRVADTLGFSSFVVGLVVGTQALVTLATRYWAGTRSDRHGPRRATVIGLALSALAGVISAVSTAIPDATVSLGILLVGRGLLGLGESFVIVGALAWGMAIAGRDRSGRVMAWVGIAMYAALAAGAPFGAALNAGVGFAGLSIAAALAPASAFIALPFVRRVSTVRGVPVRFREVARRIWLPGLGLSLSAVSFGAIAAFSALLFGERGWSLGALPMTAFGTAYVLARLLLGGLPDRFGGGRIATASAALAVIGQVGMWLGTSGEVVIVAAALTGFGFSLAFPSFGVEAIRSVPPQSRGVALGAYVGFFDATMGLGVPVLGVVVGALGTGSAYAIGAVGATASLLIATNLAVRARPTADARLDATASRNVTEHA